MRVSKAKARIEELLDDERSLTHDADLGAVIRKCPKVVEETFAVGSLVDYAVRGAQVVLFSALVDKGAPVDIADEWGRTPLFRATEPKIVELLVAGETRVNKQDHTGRTALFGARDERTAKILLDGGADPNHADEHGRTPLFHSQATTVLLAHGARPDARDQTGATPLHLRAAPELIAASSDLDIADNRGDTPMHYAVRRGSGTDIRALRAAGATEVRNHAGHRPTDLFCGYMTIAGPPGPVTRAHLQAVVSADHLSWSLWIDGIEVRLPAAAEGADDGTVHGDPHDFRLAAEHLQSLDNRAFDSLDELFAHGMSWEVGREPDAEFSYLFVDEHETITDAALDFTEIKEDGFRLRWTGTTAEAGRFALDTDVAFVGITSYKARDEAQFRSWLEPLIPNLNDRFTIAADETKFIARPVG